MTGEVQWFARCQVGGESDESGRVEVYIQSFPGPGGKVQVSTNGGSQVRWGRDGNELFYIAFDSRLMGVPVRFPPSGQAVEADAPVPLFATNVGGLGLDAVLHQKRQDKDPISAEDLVVFVENGETVTLQYHFPRDDEITLEDKDVEFITKLGQVEVKQKFKLEDMVFAEQLAL